MTDRNALFTYRFSLLSTACILQVTCAVWKIHKKYSKYIWRLKNSLNLLVFHVIKSSSKPKIIQTEKQKKMNVSCLMSVWKTKKKHPISTSYVAGYFPTLYLVIDHLLRLCVFCLIHYFMIIGILKAFLLYNRIGQVNLSLLRKRMFLRPAFCEPPRL